MKHNRLLMRFLMVALVGVWGTVAVRFFSILTSAGAAEGTETSAPPVSRNSETYKYAADVRDPFFFARHQDSARAGKKVKPQEVWTPPPIRLTGIVMGSGRQSVTVQTPDGVVYFLQEGDTLRGARLLKITPRKVTYIYAKKKNEWLMEAP